MPSTPVRRLSLCAVLTAAALALSFGENLLPLAVLLPLPGLRLGLANLVTVYALCRLSVREAALILCARCLLAALVGGNAAGLWFSLSGGVLALLTMAAALRFKKFSLVGVCIFGAAAHNTGQIVASLLYFRSPAPLLYLPPLLACSVVTGTVTGFAALFLLKRIPENTA